MNNISLISLILGIILLDRIKCKLIFEDNFDELNTLKWKVLAKKEYYDLGSDKINAFSFCNTRHKANLRTVSGKLVITPRKGTYFESSYTTATIISKTKFTLDRYNTRLLFKIRASIPIFQGVIPRIYLASVGKKRQNALMDDTINIVHYNVSLWNVLVNETSILASNLTRNIDITQFQDYKMVFDRGNFSWGINGMEMIRRNSLEAINSQDTNKFYYGFHNSEPFQLIITVNIDQGTFMTKGVKENCTSFIVDRVKVYQFSGTENDHDHDENEKYGNSTELCRRIKEYERQDYIEFIPENYPLLFKDEFDDGKGLENRWIIMGNKNSCENDNFEQRGDILESCYAPGQSNIEVSGGTLKLIVRNETFLDYNNTGARIASRLCFTNARVEIRAKYPSGSIFDFGLLMQTHKEGCNLGEVKGQLEILERNVGYSFLHTGFHVTKTKFHSRSRQELKATRANNLEKKIEFQVYGVEWSENYIQWFINDRVIFETNRVRDHRGRLIYSDLYLPFEHAFNIMLQIGKGTLKIIDTRLDDRLETWYSPVLEIDYVRVYGEISSGNLNEADEKEDNNYLTAVLIISTSLLVIILVILSLIFGILWKKQRNKIKNIKTDIYYDDVNDPDNTYEEYRLEAHEYSTLNFDEKVEHQEQNHEYLEIY